MEDNTTTKEAGDLDLQSLEQQDRAIVTALVEAEQGECKNASASGSKYIRRKIRENGFSRKILTPEQVSNEDLNRMLDTELPAIIEDMEPDQPPAKSISFNDTPDTEYYRGDRRLCLGESDWRSPASRPCTASPR